MGNGEEGWWVGRQVWFMHAYWEGKEMFSDGLKVCKP